MRVVVCVLVDVTVSVAVVEEMNVSVVVEREIGTRTNVADTRIAVIPIAAAM
ncbi:MAG: hypothetical protein ACRD6W_05165 [Nitrososphaerales archaeon]